MNNSDIEKELREKASAILRDKRADVVIGYGEGSTPDRPRAVFITEADDTDRLIWNNHCCYNLTLYLTKQETIRMGKMAVVVKGCDAKTVVTLEKESQINRPDITVIGVTCNGVGDPVASKCLTCDVHVPGTYDLLIGDETVENNEAAFEERYSDVLEITAMDASERRRYWDEQFSRCIKCYACSRICPLCYCENCIVEKNQPQWIDTSARKKGNFAWNVVRAYHLAGRCIGCGECARACPMDIPLNLINKEVAMEIEENFDFRAGYDVNDEPAMITYREDDKDNFIK